MSAKNTCLFHHYIEPSQLSYHPCKGGSHTHITDKELREYHDAGMVELVRNSGTGVRPTPAVYRMTRSMQVRGQSSKVGVAHAMALRGVQFSDEMETMYADGREVLVNKIEKSESRDWSGAMLSNIRVKLPVACNTKIESDTNGIHGTHNGKVVTFDPEFPPPALVMRDEIRA